MLGFTRRETGILLFLAGSFLAGLGINTYRTYLKPLPEIIESSVNIKEKDSQKDFVKSSNDQVEINKGIVNLNTATQEDLESINGIGPVIAGRILSYREEKGAFKSIEELNQVQGIGEKTIKKIKNQLVLN